MGMLLNLIYLLVIGCMSPWLLFRAYRTGRYRKGWAEKFLGRLAPNETEHPCIWFHAVSVGEVQLLRTLIPPLKQQFPDLPIVVTTTTNTGLELARKLFPKFSVQYAPLDFTWSIENAIRRLRPRLIAFVELELWPNWLRAAASHGIDVVLVNARMSEKSFRGYFKIRRLIRPLLQSMRWIGAQNESYAKRLISLGACPEKLSITGSMKFDGAITDRNHPEIQQRRTQFGITDQHVVLVCGSTQEPEERIAVDAFLDIAPHHPELRLVLVPRHVERCDDVWEMMRTRSPSILRRSVLRDATAGSDWRMLLVDTIGELRWFWGIANLGFVGGSFGHRGGQNMLEPAALGVSVAFGPNTWNFKDIVDQLLEAQGASVIREPGQFREWVQSMLEQPDEARRIGENARGFVARHRGAAEATIAKLTEILIEESSVSSFARRISNG